MMPSPQPISRTFLGPACEIRSMVVASQSRICSSGIFSPEYELIQPEVLNSMSPATRSLYA